MCVNQQRQGRGDENKTQLARMGTRLSNNMGRLDICSQADATAAERRAGEGTPLPRHTLSNSGAMMPRSVEAYSVRCGNN